MSIGQESNIIPALEMEPGLLYETARKHKYKCRVDRKHDPLEEGVTIAFWEGQYNRSWLEALVPLDYPVKKLGIDDHKISSRDNHNDRKSPGSKLKGKIMGLGMMESWGFYFRKYVKEAGGREQIIEAMCREFPTNGDRVRRWVDSYKSYYNMGKLPGCVKQATKVQWVTSARVPGDQIAEKYAKYLDPLALLEDEDD